VAHFSVNRTFAMAIVSLQEWVQHLKPA